MSAQGVTLSGGNAVDEVQGVIVDAIRAKVGGQPTLDDSLALLDIDSLAMAEITLEIEQKLQLRLDESVVEAQTVGELTELVRRRKQQQSG